MIPTNQSTFKDLTHGSTPQKQGRDTLYFKEGILIGKKSGRKYFVHLLHIAGLMKEDGQYTTDFDEALKFYNERGRK